MSDERAESSEGAALKKALGPGSAVLVTVGAMVGSGIFKTPHEVALFVGGPYAMLALWAAGGALSLLGALTYAEIGAALPETGGLYAHLKHAWGKAAGFVFGWAMAVVLVPSSVGYFAQISAEHALEAAGIGGGVMRVRVFAAVMIASLVGVNLVGVGAGARVQDAMTVVKYSGVLLVAALGAWAGMHPVANTAVHGAAVSVPPLTVAAVFAGLVPILWAYDGWIELTSISGEMKNPSRDVPRALVVGTLAVTALYLVVNAGYLYAIGPAGLALSETPAIATATRALGTPGRALIGAITTVSTFGGCAVSLLTGARVLFAVGRDGLFPGVLGRVSSRGAPSGALVVAGAMGLAFAASPLGKLGDLFVIGAWPFYALGALGISRLRVKASREGKEWPVRMKGQPYAAWLFALAGAGIVLAYAWREPKRTGLSFALIALGLPVFALARWVAGKKNEG